MYEVGSTVTIGEIILAFSAHNSTSNINELQSLDSSYDKILRSLIDKYAPINTRNVIDRAKTPWMNAKLLIEKRVKRRLERRWRNTGLEVDKIAFKHQKKLFDKLLRDAHNDYLTNVISENASDPKTLFKCIDSLVGSKKKNPLPEHTSEIKLAESFSDFFLKKITDIHKNIANRANVAQPLIIEERR